MVSVQTDSRKKYASRTDGRTERQKWSSKRRQFYRLPNSTNFAGGTAAAASVAVQA